MTTAGARDVRIRYAILVLLVVSLGLRVWGLDAQSIWRDEADSLHFAASPALLREMFLSPGHNAPLYYVTLRGWLGIAGSNVISARFLSVLWGACSVALMWAVGRWLFGQRVGLLSVLLAGTSPFLIWYAQEARTYSLLLATTLLSFWLYLLALDRGGPGRWALYLACTGMCFYLHVTALLLVPVHVFAGLLLRPRGKGGWRMWWSATLLLLTPAIPLLIWEVRLLVAPFQTGHIAVGASDIGAGLLLAFAAGPSGLAGNWWALPGLFLALVGIASPFLPAERTTPGRISQEVWVVLAWLLFPPMALWLVSLAMPVFSERYLIFVAPAFYLLAALGVSALWRQGGLLAIIALAAMLAVNGVGITLQATQVIKPDIRGAAEWYATQRGPGDLVLFSLPQAQGAFEEVTPAGQQGYAGAPFANRARNLTDIDPEMRSLVAAHGRVWLLESERELWDANDLTRQWLTAHSQDAVTRDFHRVTLTLFQGVNSASSPSP